MITIAKTIDWKIARYDIILDSDCKMTESTKFPINDTQDDRKICDLSFQISFSSYESDFDMSTFCELNFAIKSTPVSNPIFFYASVAIWNAEMTTTLDQAKCFVNNYKEGQEIQSYTSFTFHFSPATFKGRFLSGNGDLNIQYKVTSIVQIHCSYSYQNPNLFRRSKFSTSKLKNIRALHSENTPKSRTISIQLFMTTRTFRMSSWLLGNPRSTLTKWSCRLAVNTLLQCFARISRNPKIRSLRSLKMKNRSSK